MSRLAGVALVLAVAGCAGPATSGSPAASGASGAVPDRLELTVLAAASLRDAMTAIGATYESARPGARVTLSFDSSTALRTTIEQGAPADVFASADTTNPQRLVDAGLAAGPVTPFAKNRLVIAVADASRARIRDPRDLAAPGVRIAAAGPDVPISRYADQALAALAALPGYPPNYAAAVGANVVTREDNVRAALAKVELGDADAAIVYETDATTSSRIARVEIPDAANVVATYGAVTIGASRHPDEARAFLAWLSGPDGARVLSTFGFMAAAG